MQHEQRLLLSTVASFVEAANKSCKDIGASPIFGVASKLQLSAIALQLSECARGLASLCSISEASGIQSPSSDASLPSVSNATSDIQDQYLSEEQEKLLENIFGANDNVEQ
jgi:hypothetical protein